MKITGTAGAGQVEKMGHIADMGNGAFVITASAVAVEVKLPVVHAQNETALWNCYSILFRRQQWLSDMLLLSKEEGEKFQDLPQLEIYFKKERILVVFFRMGRLEETLKNRIHQFSQIVVIMNGDLNEADKYELNIAATAAEGLEVPLVVIDGRGQKDIREKFTYFSLDSFSEQPLKKFLQELEKAVESDARSLVERASQTQVDRRNQ